MIDVRSYWRIARILLVVGDEGVIVVPHNIPEEHPFFAPAESPRSTAEILKFIEKYPRARVTLFADTLAQDYVEDDLPPLNLFDRAKLIRRRLQQKFAAATLTASLPFRNTSHRILMIGLHEPSPLFVWAERLAEKLPNITLLPVEGTKIISRLMPEAKDGWAMLLSRQRSGGFRQIVTYKNDLVFTRLTAAETHDDAAARSIRATADYLSRLGLQSARDLALLVLTSPESALAHSIKPMEFRSLRFLTPAAAGAQLKLTLRPDENDHSADILFASFFLNSLRPELSLMLPQTRTAWRAREVQRWGMRGAYACLCVAALLTLSRAGNLVATLYQAQKEAFQLEKTSQMLEEVRRKAAPLTEPLGLMREALERRRIYDGPRQQPWHALTELSNGLDWKSKVAKIEWKAEPGTESLVVTLQLPDAPDSADRADKVVAFKAVAQNIASAMPDYRLAGIKPPYPSLPNETVSAPTQKAEEPTGEIALERKAP